MKKSSIILVLLSMFCSLSYAQRIDLTDSLWSYHKKTDKDFDLLRQNFEWKILTAPSTARTDGEVLVIPVVFHVVHHPTTQLNVEENVSVERIKEQLDILNKSFAGEYSKRPAKYPAAHTQIQFCLAKTDPQGKPTNGINRIPTTQVPFITSNATETSTGSGDAKLKSVAPAWNYKKYLNVWVTGFDDLTMGYSNFPFFTPLWIAQGDGVVVNWRYFGIYPSGYPVFNVNGGKTLPHEVGHWLGLFHLDIIQQGILGYPPLSSQCSEIAELCLDLGDKVCDTYPTSERSFNLSTCHEKEVCTTSASNRRIVTTKNFMNYQDYDDCLTLFTQGQADRMWRVIVTSRPGLLQGGGRGDDSPVAGGRTEGCTTCTTCKPITPKIIGNGIACDGEIVTYKLDAAEPYGCDVLWQVRGGEFIDYNGALGITIPYGTNLFIDSIRVKWNNIGAVHELLAIVNRCDNVDAQSLGTIATKTVTIRTAKPLSFKTPTVRVPCGSTRIFTEVIAPGTTYFEWLLPANMKLLNAMQGYTNRTDKPEALIETPLGLGGTIKVKPLGGQCGESWVSQPIELTPAAPPVVTGIPPIFCQSGDVAWVEVHGSLDVEYIWDLPEGFENIGNASGNTKSYKVQIKMTTNTRQGSIPINVSSKTPACGISPPEALLIWVGKPAGNGQIRLVAGSIHYAYPRIQTYEFLLNDSAILPDGWTMTWDLTSLDSLSNFIVLQVLGNKITIDLGSYTAKGTLSSKVKNICGETTYQTMLQIVVPPPPPPPAPRDTTNAANMRVIQQSVLKNAAKAFDNSTKTDFAAWADKAVFYTGETLLTHCLTTNPTAKPIAYLLAENGNLASPIDTLQLVNDLGMAYLQTKIPIYSGLASGNYTLKVCVGKTCIAYPITLINHLLPKTSNAGKVTEKESTNATVSVSQKFIVEQNMPNPFDEHTTLRYFLPQKNTLKVSIYNLLGLEVHSQHIENTEGWQELVLLTAKWHTG